VRVGWVWVVVIIVYLVRHRINLPIRSFISYELLIIITIILSINNFIDIIESDGLLNIIIRWNMSCIIIEIEIIVCSWYLASRPN
jgi:hypothetical protein